MNFGKVLRLTLAFLCAVATSPVLAQEGKPNVVFILADNVGYGDLGPYGGGELRGAPTPRIDQLAREGLHLTQYLVEPGCTPSRAALMTGQYSIRNGLSLIIVPGSPSTLSKGAVTMGELFKSAGYATAIFGKWHLGAEPQSLPTAHGFDEFYGIPPDISWDLATYVDTTTMTHSSDASPQNCWRKGLKSSKRSPTGHCAPSSRHAGSPRRDRHRTGGEVHRLHEAADSRRETLLPLFAVLDGAFSEPPVEAIRGQVADRPNGDKLMEGDYHVGQILDALKELGVDDNTLLVFASDNGPQGETAREMGNQGSPDMGNSGPFRGELGEATEGSIRTFCFVRWPGKVKPDTSSYAMFSIMDFFPTFARLIGSKIPTDRPIDGVDQTDVLFGKSETGNRDSLLTFIGADMVAARWKQWRMYFTDVHPTGIGPQRDPGMFSASAPMAGYPKIYNIEMDPHEDLQVGALFGWAVGPALEVVEKYKETLKRYPNPPAGNLTCF